MIHFDRKRKLTIAFTWVFLIINRLDHVPTSALNFQLPKQLLLSTARRGGMNTIRYISPSKSQDRYSFRFPPSPAQHFSKLNANDVSNKDEDSRGRFQKTTSLLWLYVNALRPFTILQAVGALIVGYLSIFSPSSSISRQATTKSSSFLRLLAAMVSVYLSYGSGMVMNDCVDASSDAMHTNKQDRAIASGQISRGSATKYVGILSTTSLMLAYYCIDCKYALWTLWNLIVMIGYALKGQRVFLLKNFICGWLAISPLIGASLLSDALSPSVALSSTSLGWLAAVGFPMHVSREIIKDIEDVDIDRETKRTLPLVVGEKLAHRIAYGIVALVCGVMVLTPVYWQLFGPSPCYPLSVVIGMPMCARAYLLPIEKGQKLLKKSIYVLLAGMIGGLLWKP